MRENVDNNHATNSRKLLGAPPALDPVVVRTRGEVLLPFPRLTTRKELSAHRLQLQRLKQERIAAWILLDTVTGGTRFWLNFLEHTFHQSEGSEAIQRRFREWAHTTQTSDRVYLLAQENTDAPCYDITAYIQPCIDGDLSVADRLKGRTIFRLHQTEAGGYDLLSQQGVDTLVHELLDSYIQEFGDLIHDPVLGFCCEFPTFLSPLKVPESAVPWSKAFAETLEPELLAHLPLIHYENLRFCIDTQPLLGAIHRTVCRGLRGAAERICSPARVGIRRQLPISGESTGCRYWNNSESRRPSYPQCK